MLQEKAKLIAENESSKIGNYLSSREIMRVLHFAPGKNLKSILENGLLSQNELWTRSIDFIAPDKDRWDGLPNGICCSLTFPNRYLLHKKIKKFGWNFVVIEFPANTLLFKKFACFPSNASRKDLRPLAEANPENFTGIRGLSRLFCNEPLRIRNKLPKDQPTDNQSELLIFEPILFFNIRKVHIPTKASSELSTLVRELQTQYESLEFEFDCKCAYFELEGPGHHFSKWQLDWC